MPTDHEAELDEHAGQVAEMLWKSGDQEVKPEVLRLDKQSRAIVADVYGVDYVLTMTRAPKQRLRPLTD